MPAYCRARRVPPLHVRLEEQRADPLAAKRDVAEDLDVLAGEAMPLSLDRRRELRRRLAVTVVAGEDSSVGAVQDRRDQIRLRGECRQLDVGRLLVIEGERRRAVVGHDLRLGHQVLGQESPERHQVVDQKARRREHDGDAAREHPSSVSFRLIERLRRFIWLTASSERCWRAPADAS